MGKAAQIISFVHHKGGTGKTTACINLAGFLAKMQQRVLVVDLDPQANATAGLGIDRETLPLTLYDVLFERKKITDIILNTASGVHVAPASIDLIAAESQITKQRVSVGFLRPYLDSIRSHYDYILLDVPPGSTMLMMNGIVAADEVIIPVDSGVFGIETLETLGILFKRLEEELDIQTHVLAILLRKYPVRLGMSNPNAEIRALLNSFLESDETRGIPILEIPYSKAVYEAQMVGMPISHCKPRSHAARAFKKVTNLILSSQTIEKADATEARPLFT